MKTLKDKLTDEGETIEVLEEVGEFSHDMPSWTQLNVFKPWWLRRELARIGHGIYRASAVTTKLNKTMQGQYCLHVSVEDDTLIAFTPTVEMGQQDRQLKMALGKFLRKYFLLFTDRYISELEAQHRAEVSAVMLIATTVEDITRVYRYMDGDSGCMRYDYRHFGLIEGQHPSMVYATPGMGVAYYEIDGVIKARSVVYANGEDKRYVRIYGDPVLKGMLERNGYVLKSLAGLELNTVKHDDNVYVMPYLDGIGGDQSKIDGTKIVLHRGRIRVLSLKEQQRLNEGRTASYVYGCKGQGGKISLVECPDLEATSNLTGLSFSRLEHTAALCLVAGVIGQAPEDEIPEAWDTVLALHVGRWVNLFCPPDTATYVYDRDRYLEGAAQRSAHGFEKLSLLHYPNGSQWERNLTQLASGEWVRHTDVAYILPIEGEEELVFSQDLKALRKEGYVNAYTTRTTKQLIHKARPSLRTSDTGVVFDCERSSPYVNLYGTDLWVNKIKTKHVLAADAYLLKSDPRGPLDLMTDAALVSMFTESSAYEIAEDDCTNEMSSWESRMERRFASEMLKFSAPDMDTNIRYGYRVSLSDAVRQFETVTGERTKSQRVYAAYIAVALPLLALKVSIGQFRFAGDQRARFDKTLADATRLGLMPAAVTEGDVQTAVAMDTALPTSVESTVTITAHPTPTGLFISTAGYPPTGWATGTSTTATTY